MEYKINDQFRIQKKDNLNWVVLSKRTGKLKTDFGGKKAGDSFENEDVVGYGGSLTDAWKILIRKFPNYVERKTSLNQTIKDIKNLLNKFG